MLVNGKGFWTYVLILHVLILGGCGSKEAVNQTAPAIQQDQAQEEKKVEAVEVFPKPISYTLSAVGSLRTPEHVTLSPKKAGIIKKIYVKEGDRVRREQILVELDDVDARLQIERAEARVREAEASMEANRVLLVRYQKLLESKVIPQQTFEDITLKFKLDETRVALVKTELDLARQNLQDHRIVSSIDGIVNLKIASIGEHVNVAPKDEILTIVQMDPLDLEFFVPEVWVSKVRLRDRVTFTVKPFSEEKFSAILHFISPTADPATRNVKMRAIVSNSTYRLKPGFFAEVTLHTGTHPKALVIPESAIFNQEGKAFVFLVQNGMAHRREVVTGHRFEGQVEILKGTQKGDRVVTAGHQQLSEGMKVRISKQ